MNRVTEVAYKIKIILEVPKDIRVIKDINNF